MKNIEQMIIDQNNKINKIKEVIINLLFEVKKDIVTEVTIKSRVDCYNVNIKAVVTQINNSGLYPKISCYYNGSGVLILVF